MEHQKLKSNIKNYNLTLKITITRQAISLSGWTKVTPKALISTPPWKRQCYLTLLYLTIYLLC